MSVLTPEEIVDSSYPLLGGEIVPESGNSSNPTPSETRVVTEIDKKFPPSIIAQETISQSLDTASRKIKGDYTFEEMGALEIKSSVHPLAGVAISPSGVVATDANGDETFALDAETGDATFRGTLQAQTVIGGGTTVIIEEGSTGGRIVLYNSGIPSIVIGDPS